MLEIRFLFLVMNDRLFHVRPAQSPSLSKRHQNGSMGTTPNFILKGGRGSLLILGEFTREISFHPRGSMMSGALVFTRRLKKRYLKRGFTPFMPGWGTHSYRWPKARKVTCYTMQTEACDVSQKKLIQRKMFIYFSTQTSLAQVK